MVICSAFGCKSRTERKESGITFHRFPVKDLQRCKLWVKNMNIVDWEPSSNSRLCSKHFENHLFYKIGTKTCLLDEAVPTIFAELPKYMKPQKQLKRRHSRSSEEPIGTVPSTSKESVSPTSLGTNVEDPDSPRKKRLRSQLLQEKVKSKQKSRKIKVLGQKVKRCKKKIVSLKQIIRDLKSTNLLSSEDCLIMENMPEVTKELLKRNTKKKSKYSPELRKFAITLSFFSPKAYDYVRNVFNTCLPHRSTIGKWFKNVKSDPGFTKEAFDILKMHTELSDKPTFLSLIVDEISIRQQLQWDGRKMHGYVNYGVDLEDDTNSVAKEAFVLMAVCMNGRWKLPLGYFFANGLSGNQKSSLIVQCIRLVTEVGAHIVSLTFDGAPSNITMAQNLGCKTEITNIQSHFSINEKNIYIFFDPCHMLKLVRNTFGEKKYLKDENGHFIKWEYVEKLQELQDAEGLHLGNKLRKAHVNFFKQKMKVRLAVQLLSSSVADALTFCEQTLKLKQFVGCQATARFIIIFNNIFDILNSRSLVPPSYKKALCEKNIEKTRNFINNQAIPYICSLRLSNNELVINSKRKTGFVGLIVTLKSALSLFDQLICHEKSLLYLPLYKVSQDHLELFFSTIRAKGGWNNNPNARQFSAAYKRLLVRAEIREGGIGNCIPLDDIPILTGGSRFEQPEYNIKSDRYSREEMEQESELETIWSDHDYIMNYKVITQCSMEIIIYIAGFVSRKLQNTIKCEDCVGALLGERENFLYSLISKKNQGGLTYPSNDVIKICKTAEHFLRINDAHIFKRNFFNSLKIKIINNCVEDDCFRCLGKHILECSNNHIYFLIESVVSKYLNIRIHFITKKQSEIENPIRAQFTKLILFKGQ